MEADIPNETTLSQLLLNFVFPFLNGKLDARTLFRWKLPKDGEKNLVPIPVRLPGEYGFKIVATMISTKPRRPKLVQLTYGDASFYLQVSSGALVVDLNRAATDFLNGRGQGGVFAVDASLSEPINFDRCYNIQANPAQRDELRLGSTSQILSND
jgi:hypothetical protein